LGADLIQNARKQAEGAGARIVEATVEKVDLSAWPFAVNLDDGTTMHALTLIIATGSRPILLGIPGEKKYWANGVSACARCDALFYKGKNVVVIGGGDVAIEEATELARFAKKVTIIHRRGQLRAAGRMQTRLKSYPQINLMYDTTVKEILGDQKKVTGISIVHAGKQETMPIDGVFLAIGHKPNIELFKNILETDDDGCLVLPGGNQQTSVPGVFAAGDVANHYRQAIVAAGRGAEAAIDAIEFLESVGFTLDEAEKLKAAVAAQVQHEKQNTREQ
jgi:thioredoxin reductase (NADPH)